MLILALVSDATQELFKVEIGYSNGMLELLLLPASLSSVVFLYEVLSPSSVSRHLVVFYVKFSQNGFWSYSLHCF